MVTLHCHVPLWSSKAGCSRLLPALTRAWSVGGFSRASVINQKLCSNSSRSWLSHHGWTCCQGDLPLVYSTLHTDEEEEELVIVIVNTERVRNMVYEQAHRPIIQNQCEWIDLHLVWWPLYHQSLRQKVSLTVPLHLCTCGYRLPN